MANDPTFSNVTTLLDFDGSLTDQSDAGVSWAISSANLTPFEFKFGSQSLRISSGGSLQYSSLMTSLFDVRGRFTVQMWVKPDAIGGEQSVFSSGGLDVYINSSGYLVVDGGSVVVNSDTSLTAGAWHYIEVSRDNSGVWRSTVDGNVSSFAIFESTSVADSPAITIGRTSTRQFVGCIDDLRITDGETLNTSSYTPPTSAHPTSGGGGPAPIDVRISLDSPLRSDPLANAGGTLPQFVASLAEPSGARLAAPSPLGEPSILATRSEASISWASAPSPLAPPSLSIVTDFTAQITDPTERYAMRITGDPPVEVPISSWQATVQDQRSSFLQCVVPAVGDYIDAITARQGLEQMAVYRQTTIEGQFFETEMARADLSTVVVNRGHTRETCTLSGYTDAFSSPVAPSTVQLQGVRSSSQTIGGSARVRASIDWLLRPGQTVTDGTISFTVSYINYFVPTVGDAYMDVGSRG